MEALLLGQRHMTSIHMHDSCTPVAGFENWHLTENASWVPIDVFVFRQRETHSQTDRQTHRQTHTHKDTP